MGKCYTSREVIKILIKDGWILQNISGDHHQFKHLKKKGRVTVPHPKKELEKYEVSSIKRQSGIAL